MAASTLWQVMHKHAHTRAHTHTHSTNTSAENLHPIFIFFFLPAISPSIHNLLLVQGGGLMAADGPELRG